MQALESTPVIFDSQYKKYILLFPRLYERQSQKVQYILSHMSEENKMKLKDCKNVNKLFSYKKSLNNFKGAVP